MLKKIFNDEKLTNMFLQVAYQDIEFLNELHQDEAPEEVPPAVATFKDLSIYFNSPFYTAEDFLIQPDETYLRKIQRYELLKIAIPELEVKNYTGKGINIENILIIPHNYSILKFGEGKFHLEIFDSTGKVYAKEEYTFPTSEKDHLIVIPDVTFQSLLDSEKTPNIIPEKYAPNILKGFIEKTIEDFFKEKGVEFNDRSES